jgi:hypothetical protein
VSKGLVILLVTLVASVAVALAPSGSVARESAARPALNVRSLAPVTLVGERFRGRERVVVRMTTSEETRSRHVRATRRGAFVTQFAGVVVDRCNSDFTAVAVGILGSRAEAKIPQLQCPPRLRGAQP